VNPGEALLLRADIRHEKDVVLVRQRARHLAQLLGFDPQDQTRVATSVSEIARNAYEYAGGGRVSLTVSDELHPAFLVRVADDGPGIADVDTILEGRYRSRTGMGLGIVGARRLADRFDIVSKPGAGTVVTLGKLLPPGTPRLTPERIEELARLLIGAEPHDPIAELQARNHELLRALDELRMAQGELERLNGELAETNQGVLALYAELDDRALQLARESELKSKFLSGISHELRTPLNAIQNLTRLLLDELDGPLSSEQQRQVTMIRDAAAALTDMVSDLLDLARIEAGKTRLRLGEFMVGELLASLRGMLRPILTGDAVAFHVESCRPDCSMHSDEGRVSQILRNLVANAAKFTETGEIRVTAAHDEVRDHIDFRVSDTGIGIERDHLDRIFEEYVQLDSPLHRKARGTGLGLPLSRKLSELLGGSLVVESEPGRGSTFTLSLPRICPVAAEETGQADIAAGEGAIQRV